MRSGPLGLLRQTCTHCDGRGYVEYENVIVAPIVSKIEAQPDDVLRHSIGQLQSCIVIGFDKDGEEYYASSIADGATALWLLARMQHLLLSIVDKDE